MFKSIIISFAIAFVLSLITSKGNVEVALKSGMIGTLFGVGVSLASVYLG